MLATDMTASGSPEEKLRWAFKMYDKDGSGRIYCAVHMICLLSSTTNSFTKKHLFLFINPCLAELTCDCLSDRLHRTKGDDRNNWDSLSDGGSSKGLSKHSNLLFLKSPLLGISGRSSSVNLQHS